MAKRCAQPLARAGMKEPLPQFIEPMLASSGEAFDSDEYLFEIKWDGTRALAFVDANGWRLFNRRNRDISERYPEFAVLAQLPSGTVLDGEVVVLRADGKPDFAALQSREQGSAARAAQSARLRPATFMAFDQLYRQYQSIMQLTLAERREILDQTITGLESDRVVMSRGITGGGKAYFESACREGLEGIVAKRLSSHYLPGKRSDAWIKIKRQEVMHCAVIGFVPEGKDDFGALIIAGEIDGAVKCVGKVGTGFNHRMRQRINAYLWSHLRNEPVVRTKEKGLWVETGLYCAVRYMERTSTGQLRAPVLVELYDR